MNGTDLIVAAVFSATALMLLLELIAEYRHARYSARYNHGDHPRST